MFDEGKGYYEEERYDEARDSFQAALSCYQDAEDRGGAADSLKFIGVTYAFQAHYDEAREHLEQALAFYQKLDNTTEQVKILSNIGITYYRQEKWQDALEYHEQAITLAHTRTISETANPSLSTSLVQAGDIYDDRGEQEKALDYLLEALPLTEPDEKDKQATVKMFLAEIYESSGEFDQAIRYAEEAADLYREGEWADKNSFVAANLDFIATIYFKKGYYSESTIYHKQALALWETEDNLEQQALTLNMMGGRAETLGNLKDALQFRIQALELMQKTENIQGIALTSRYIGVLYGSLEDYQRARFYYNQALEAWDFADESLEKNIDMAEIYETIGITYNNENNYKEARSNYEKARKLWQVAERPEDQAGALNLIAQTYWYEDKLEQALEHHEQALLLLQEKGGDSFEIPYTLRNISLVNFHLGNTTEAEAYLEQAIEQIETLPPELHLFKPVLYGHIALLYEHKRLALPSDEILQKTLEYYNRALQLYQESGDQEGTASTLSNMGDIYEEQGEDLRALDVYTQSIAIRERIRGEAVIEELKTSFAETHSFVDVYQRTILLLLRLERSGEAFNMSERARARTFLDQMENTNIDILEGVDSVLIEREQALRNELTILRNELTTLQKALLSAQNTDDLQKKEIEEKQGEINEKQQEYEELLTRIKLENPQYVSVISVSTLAMEEIQQILDDETTLLSYYVAPEQTLAFILTRDSFHTIEIDAGIEELTTLVRILHSTPPVTDAPPPEATTLYQTLIAPLKDHLTTPHLAIIPHGVLHYLPFAALSPDGTHYLIDDYTLTLLPSATSLQYIQENTGNKSNTALVVGNPASPAPGLAPLYHAEQEAETIATLYGTEPLLREAATEAEIRKQAAGMGVLHLAAHGQFNLANPLYSTIELAPGGDEDGRLEVHEVYSLDLQQTDMVVLSACVTNLPHLGAGMAVSGGDEIVGLTRAFLYASTPTIISTLWQVEDHSTALLMERFYTHYRAGMGKAAALRQAQFEVREQYPHFSHWAGVVLSGDGGAMGGEPPIPPPASVGRVWFLVIGTLLVIGVVGSTGIVAALAFWRRRRA